MINFIYAPCRDNIILNQAKPENYVCNISIADASYSLNALGYVYPNVRVHDSNYLGYIANILSSIDNNLAIQIYVNTDDIFQHDNFEVYTIDDVDNHEYKYGLLWKLKSRLSLNNDLKSISLRYSPTVCPLCSDPLADQEIYDTTVDNVKRCVNSHCWINKYVAINRYLSIACRLPELTNFAKRYVDIGKVNKPSDLYKLDIYDTIFSSDPSIENQLEKLAETRGNIKLSDYLLSLPAVDYNISGFKIKSRNIDSDFSPTRFIMYIYELSNQYVKIQNEYLNKNKAYFKWKEKCGLDIQSYMSLPAFFEYALYFYKRPDNINALTELENMGIFKPNNVSSSNIHEKEYITWLKN